MIDLRKNKKTVGEVISEGILTIEEILEYAQRYMDAMDAFDDEQLGEWECSEYEPINHMTEQEMELERMRMLDEMYGDYLHQEMLLIEELGFDYDGQKTELEREMDNYEPIWTMDSRPANPDYIIASTSYRLNETVLFWSNENGDIVSPNDYGGLAERWNNTNWKSHQDAVNSVFGSSYELVWERRLSLDSPHHALYKRISNVVE
jgi:hypothetical protein